jgi:hypothetical protein
LQASPLAISIAPAAAAAAHRLTAVPIPIEVAINHLGNCFCIVALSIVTILSGKYFYLVLISLAVSAAPAKHPWQRHPTLLPGRDGV